MIEVIMVVEENTGRSQLFKNSSRADDSRRNRQDMVSKLRKDKRNEQMLKRRQVRLSNVSPWVLK